MKPELPPIPAKKIKIKRVAVLSSPLCPSVAGQRGGAELGGLQADHTGH